MANRYEGTRTLENLKMVCDEYQTQMNLSSNLRK